ncbi:hypothetical protein C8F01DRAFT_987159, partial [Mycena amicta]
CKTCCRAIKRNKFVALPLYSWANGCWIGDRPPELSDLTYVEELVIAKAHTTKCWAKINTASNTNPLLQQRAASGNVCIHPHEISELATQLPRPMSSLYDEIVVIVVAGRQEANAETFRRTPLIVRRGYILRALNWLKAHNPLYRDIQIDYAALQEYPSDEDGCVPFPVQSQAPNATISGQNATYSGHGIDKMEEMFAESTDVDSEQDAHIPVSVSGKNSSHFESIVS